MRTHGHIADTGVGLNQLTTNGNTPTGLAVSRTLDPTALSFLVLRDCEFSGSPVIKSAQVNEFSHEAISIFNFSIDHAVGPMLSFAVQMTGLCSFE